MSNAIEFLVKYGYAVLFTSVLAEQIGIPLPSTPVLLAMGALAASGRYSLATALLLATIAAFLGDLVWYQLGRVRGHSILRLLCKISLEPDSCVSGTEGWFERLGGRALLISKFVPGLSTVAPPMAGASDMSFLRFFAWDGAGCVVWSAAFLAIGFAFSAQLETVLAILTNTGSWLGAIVGGSLALYIGWKFYKRQKFLKDLRGARITAEEVYERVTGGEDLYIVDLRSASELHAVNEKIAKAIWFDVKELEARHTEIPRDRDIILYCS